MPQLAYLGQMLEERGGFAVRLCPEGLVELWQFTQIAYSLSL